MTGIDSKSRFRLFSRALFVTGLLTALATPALADSPEDSRTWVSVSLQQLLLLLPGGSGSLGKCTVTIGGDADQFSIEFSATGADGKAVTRKLEFPLLEGDFVTDNDWNGTPRAPSEDMKFPEPDETDRRHGLIEMHPNALFKSKTTLRLFFDRNEQKVVGARVDDEVSCGDPS